MFQSSYQEFLENQFGKILYQGQEVSQTTEWLVEKQLSQQLTATNPMNQNFALEYKLFDDFFAQVYRLNEKQFGISF